MKLVLAEKPSVAMSYGKILGATKRNDGYLSGNGYLVSWCIGHLVELTEPEAYDERYKRLTIKESQSLSLKQKCFIYSDDDFSS